MKTTPPGEAVDGIFTKDTCYWSAPDNSHWWMVDLGQDFSLYKIRITNSVSCGGGGGGGGERGD